MHSGVREALVFHLLFFAAAAAVLWLLKGTALGQGMLWLTVGYHLALPAWALLRGRSEWLWLWLFLLPLSAAQVLPDWALVEITRTLVFPDHGLPRIGGAVPVIFIGLWAMLLFPILLLGQASRHPYWTTAALALIAFTFCEWAARPLQLWHGQNVTLVYGVAVYTLIPEMLLSLCALYAYRSTRSDWLPTRIVAAVGVSVFYAGALVLSLLLSEYLFSIG